MRAAWVLALAVLQGGRAAGQGAPATGARYEVRFSAADPREVRVAVDFVATDTLMRMAPYGMEHLPDGWRTFIREECLRDASGHEVGLTRLDGRRWRIGAPLGAALHLEYVVRLEHDLGDVRWFPGPREAAYVRDGMLFALGRALFIVPDWTMRDTELRVSAPDGWQVAVALRPAGAGRWRAPSRRDLTDALVVAGRFMQSTVSAGGVEFEYAVAGSYAGALPVFSRVTRSATSTFADLFGGPPARNRYLVAVGTEPEHTDGFGGAFSNGFSMTFPFPPSEANAGLWGFTLTHEVFHLWNAYTLERGGPDEEWFLEGGADYCAWRTLARGGVYSRTEALHGLERAYSTYRHAGGRAALTEAGREESRNGDLLYKGGWIVLAALDLDLRLRTGGRRSLDDVFRALADRGRSGTPVYRTEDIERLAGVVGGTSYREFFDRYVRGREVLDLGPYLRAAGLELVDSSVREVAAPTPDQLARREAWLGAGGGR